MTARGIDDDIGGSLEQWRGILGAPSRTRVCARCDVSWDSEADENCWCCGRPGAVALDVFRRSVYGAA